MEANANLKRTSGTLGPVAASNIVQGFVIVRVCGKPLDCASETGPYGVSYVIQT
jgi:hypothetical protein